MGTDERRVLRSAVYRRDGEAIVAELAGVDLNRSLQVAGSALLIPLEQDTAGVRVLAEQCAAALRGRGWEGDEELASELDVAMGMAEPTPLTDLVVDLEALSELLESGDFEGGAVNLHTGEVWRSLPWEFSELDEGGPDLDDPDEWLLVSGNGSRKGYRDMEWFIAMLDDAGVADRLSIAINGKGAFGRFRGVLSRYEDLEDQWYRFSEERRWGRTRAWLAWQGYRPVPPPPTTPAN